MRIETGKLTKEELASILKKIIKPISKQNNKSEVLEKLDLYNTANYFCIKKFYKGNELVGFGVIFLGYNTLASNDISIDNIAYWGNDEDFLRFLIAFGEELKYSKGLPFPAENIYYDETSFIEEVNIAFDTLGFKTMGLSR